MLKVNCRNIIKSKLPQDKKNTKSYLSTSWPTKDGEKMHPTKGFTKNSRSGKRNNRTSK